MNGRSITGSRLRREALIRGLSNCPSANIERRAPSRCGRRRAVRSYPPSGRTRNRALSHRPLLGFPGTAPTTDIPRDRKSGTHSKTELSSGTDHIAPPKKQQMPAAPHIPSRNRPHSTAVKATDARCAPYTLPEPTAQHRSKSDGCPLRPIYPPGTGSTPPLEKKRRAHNARRQTTHTLRKYPNAPRIEARPLPEEAGIRYQRLRGYFPCSIIRSMEAIRAGLSSL